MALASRPTRQRGRRWLLVGALATVVVLAVNAAMSARSPAPARQLAEQSYVDQILPAIQSSTQQGRDIDAVRAQAVTLTGTVIATRIDQVAANAQATLGTVERLTPPKDMQLAHDLLVAALDIRVETTHELHQAMTGALSGQDVQSAVNALVAVGQDFTASDRAYGLFVKAATPKGPPLPASTWVPDTSVYAPANLTVLLAALKAATSLAPIHDTSIVFVTTAPAPVSMDGATEVLPIARVLNLQIVVADIGNQPEKNLTVSATIAPSAIGPSQMVRDFVDLAPGQRRTVDLGGLRLPPGQPTTLSVKIDTVPGETNVEDNVKAIAMVMR